MVNREASTSQHILLLAGVAIWNSRVGPDVAALSVPHLDAPSVMGNSERGVSALVRLKSPRTNPPPFCEALRRRVLGGTSTSSRGGGAFNRSVTILVLVLPATKDGSSATTI